MQIDTALIDEHKEIAQQWVFLHDTLHYPDLWESYSDGHQLAGIDEVITRLTLNSRPHLAAAGRSTHIIGQRYGRSEIADGNLSGTDGTRINLHPRARRPVPNGYRLCAIS